MYQVDVIKPGVLVRDRFGNILDARSTVSLITGDGRIIVIDTGLSSERGQILTALAHRGLAPEEVDTLINTHAHMDHTGNNDLFSGARLIGHGTEFGWREQKGNCLLVVEDTDIAEGIRILTTPGHTRGSITVLVDGRVGMHEGSIALTGDALPIMDNYLKWVPPGININPDLSLSSMQKIIENAEIIIPGHDRPFRIGSNDVLARNATYLD